METIAGLMWDPRLGPYQSEIFLEYLEVIYNDEQVASEMCNGRWWKKTEKDLREKHGPDSYLLPLVLHIDSTMLDVTNKHSATPVSLSLGNFSNHLRV